MTEPTQAAMRAVKALNYRYMCDINADKAAQIIDDATDLPRLIAQRDALLAACREVHSFAGRLTADGHGKLVQQVSDAIALCQPPETP